LSIWISPVSFLLGLFICLIACKIKISSFERLSREILHKAQKEIETKWTETELSLKQKEIEHQHYLNQLTEERRKKLDIEKERFEKREEKLDKQLTLVENKLIEIKKRENQIGIQKTELKELRSTLTAKETKILSQLEQLGNLTSSEAKTLLLEKTAREVRLEACNLTLQIKKETQEEAKREATQILCTAINRLALPTVSEVTVSMIPLPNEEMKRRVIGREGRNIRALEHATGVNFVIDDGVVISGFDPIRKEVAKRALRKLIKDGRIHPTRIEAVVAKTQKELQEQIKTYGEDAAIRAGILNLHPEIIRLLGELKFRYSFGQNILEHSMEVCYLMSIMMQELGLNSDLAKRIGLLHDIGKAVSHETEGSHALIGYETALKFGEKEEVANGIGCHHDEIPPKTIEASLCCSANKISGSRVGARIEALEQYIKRARKLESLSSQFEGVKKAYALQAGREVRVIVEPDYYDDASMICLAQDLAKNIEKELSYSGRIKITIIREQRAIEYAT